MIVQISLSTDFDVADSERAGYVSDECHRHILRSVGGVFVLFPGMRSWFRGVRYTKKLTSSFDPFGRMLVLSTFGLNGTVKEAQDALANANKPGFSVMQERGLDSLVAHELGHAVDHWIRWKNSTDDDALDEYQDQKINILKKLGPPSEYAKTNRWEQFAEQFALEFLRGDSKARLINMLLSWRDR